MFRLRILEEHNSKQKKRVIELKKRYIASALGVGIAGYVLRSTKKRKNDINSSNREFQEDATLYNAGKPDQVDELEIDQLENAKMVSEGSQFGVQYYNHVKENE
jgi:hypothetical protein